ncbi:MAG: hypothetical protein K2P35_01665 [Lachnospiraceae bacterium]|nr:hypothetical protein [Lachnospiraceae bacterium]
MTGLLVFREQLKKFYSKYEVYITPASKFLLALIALLVINGSIGYMSELKSFAVVMVLSLMCSFLPTNFIIMVAALVTLGHLYKFSIECAVVALAVFLLLFILYFRFSPKDTLVVILTPICFALKIPYVIPLAVGLVGTPFSVVSVASGIIVYWMLNYMNASASVLSTFEEDGALEKFRYVIDGLLGNRAMFVTIVAFVVTLLVVYFIRRLSVDYAWTIAIITGALLDILILLFGDLMYNTNLSIIGLILGNLVAGAAAKALEFFVFNVDYSRTERVQFEDDEYYYYVKAVPKNTVAAPQKRVKTIRVPDKAVKASGQNSGRQKRD